MFLFTKKSLGTFYKPNIENIKTTYSKTNTFIIPNKEYPPTIWTRTFFDKSRDCEFEFQSIPYHETLVSSVVKKEKRNNENYGIILCKSICILGYFFNKWFWKKIRFYGFLNWFHPWIVVRHRYFYRGY